MRCNPVSWTSASKGLLAAAALTQGGAARPAQDEHGAMMSALRAAARTGHVRVMSLGRSVEGRAIPMAAIGPESARWRVVVLCRQHGDETASTAAALRVVARAAAGEPALKSRLNGVLLCLVPMVNPDGAARQTRLNASRVDLNRDWMAQTQPETRAVARAVRRLRPQALLDEHQWSDEDRYGADWLETPNTGSAMARAIQRDALRAGTAAGIPLKAVRSAAARDARLAHRFFQSRDTAAFLLETTPYVDARRRQALYEGMMVRMAAATRRHAPSRSLPGALATFPTLYAPPQRAPFRLPSAPPVNPWPVAAMAVGLALAMWRRPARPTSPDSTRAPRGHRRPLTSVTRLAQRLEMRRALARERALRTARRMVEQTWEGGAAQRRAAWTSNISSTSPRVSPVRRATSVSGTPSRTRRATSPVSTASVSPVGRWSSTRSSKA